MRLDLYLVENKICESRNKAAALIKEQKVTVNNKIVSKPSFDVGDLDDIKISSNCYQYVARSAHKLLTAKAKFNLSFSNKVAVDLGSSTGGFCEVMLQNGIKNIYAVDIGTNQLHSRIRDDKRVFVMENTNARYLAPDMFKDEIDIVTCDLSFISLKLILSSAYSILKQQGEFICLVKPQFEVGPDFVGKNGVVKDKKARLHSVVSVIEHALKIGFSLYDISFSGLEGESGNKEYLLYLIKDNKNFTIDASIINNVVLGD